MNRFYKGDKCKRCGKPITVKNKSGFCRSCGLIGNKRALGFRHSEKTKKKMAVAHLGDKNGMWKGDNAGYYALHRYVEVRLPKPDLCSCCGLRKPYDLANKGIYNRDLKNWEWLCRKCHMEKDGRIKNLKQYKCQN